MRERGTLTAGIWILGTLVVLVVAGSGFWPVDPDRTLDPAVAALSPPGARWAVVRLADGRELAAGEARIEGSGVALERPIPPFRIEAGALHGGSAESAITTRRFWLGSDKFGRDVAARLLAGGRTSLAAALLALAVILLLGVPAGTIAAMSRPAIARPLLRLFEALQAFPRLFLLLALAAAVRPGFVAVALLLGATGWVPMARLVRAEVRSLQAREFVLAARVVGVGPWRMALRHLLPNAAAPIAVEASLAAAAAILNEAALSFLGFGLQPPSASWGNMIADGRETLAGGWWVALFPGLAIVIAAISFNLIGEGARDALDPRAARTDLSRP